MGINKGKYSDGYTMTIDSRGRKNYLRKARKKDKQLEARRKYFNRYLSPFRSS